VSASDHDIIINTSESRGSGYGEEVVIKLRLAAGSCELFQCGSEFLQRLQRRILRQICKRQPNVVGVMEGVRGNCVRFETLDEFCVGHCLSIQNAFARSQRDSIEASLFNATLGMAEAENKLASVCCSRTK